MKNSFIQILLLSFLFFQSCGEKEDCHKTINFKNNSSKSLYIHASNIYPTTIEFANEFPNPALNEYAFKVEMYSSNTRALRSRSCIEYKYNSSIMGNILMVYVFDAHVLENTPWDTVKANYKILKRYDLSLEDLQRMNWTITYP